MSYFEPRVVIDHAAVQKFIRNPDGPVARRMMVVAEAVRTETVASLADGFPKEFLGPTIVKRTAMTEEGPRIVVGSSHTRTQPHAIIGNPLLVFFWQKAGKVVFLHRVNHPGSDFNNYLLDKLIKALEAVRRI